jgi:hypothetical protein
LLGLSLLAGACSNDDAASDPESDPMNAMVELGRPVERHYDRTEWVPGPLAEAQAVADRTTATAIGCLDPGPVDFGQVRSSHELVQLPMPAAIVQCFSNGEDEDLLFTAFEDEDEKDTYIEAKAELICGRALGFGSEQSETMAGFDGIVYVDFGTVILEPDSFAVRDALAEELGGTASKMCPEAIGDRPMPTTSTTPATNPVP